MAGQGGNKYYQVIQECIVFATLYNNVEPPKGKTGNVRFYTIVKIEKQSLKNLCSSLGKII